MDTFCFCTLGQPFEYFSIYSAGYRLLPLLSTTTFLLLLLLFFVSFFNVFFFLLWELESKSKWPSGNNKKMNGFSADEERFIVVGFEGEQYRLMLFLFVRIPVVLKDWWLAGDNCRGDLFCHGKQTVCFEEKSDGCRSRNVLEALSINCYTFVPLH